MVDYEIGDKKYTLEELQALIGDGEAKREYETKYNTNFDSAWSAYGKAQNENKQLKEELEKVRSAPVETPKSEPNLDEIFNQKGVVTKDQIDRMLDEKLTSREQVQSITKKFGQLGKEIDGSDGRPKFDNDEIMGFMQENNILDPEQAYKLKHLDELANWKAEQLSKKPGFAPTNTTETATNKTPAAISYNRDNVDAALREALSERGGKV